MASSEESTPSKKKDKDIAADTHHHGDPFMLLPEQRLMMRTIPFFVLPAHENIPKTSHVKARVDTHNTSYVPRPSSSSTAQAYSHRNDYTHIKSRVDTGRGTSPCPSPHKDGSGSMPRRRKGSAEELRYPRVNSVRRDYRRPLSAGPYRRQTNLQYPTTGFPPATVTSSKYKNVKSRIGSLDNIHYKPGGGSTKIINQATPSRPVEHQANPFGNPTATVLKERHKGKAAAFRASDFKPGKVKSRIDQSDPNPAHWLKHSLEELTIPEGQSLNPRFHKEGQSPSDLHKSHTFDSISQLLKEEEEEQVDSSLNQTQTLLPRSATFEFLSTIEPLSDSEPVSPSSRPSQSVKKEEDTAMATVLDYAPASSGVKRKLYFDVNHQSPTAGDGNHQEDIDLPLLNHSNASVQPEPNTTRNKFKGHNAFMIDEKAPSPPTVPEFVPEFDSSTNGHSADLDIYDIEVSNSASETTVVLKHLLALSGKNGSSNSTSDLTSAMPIIEESESGEEEEEEEEDCPKLELAPYTLAHPIPELVISDEDGSIVATISVGVNLCTIASGSATVTHASTEDGEDVYAPDIIGTQQDVRLSKDRTNGDVEPITQL